MDFIINTIKFFFLFIFVVVPVGTIVACLIVGLLGLVGTHFGALGVFVAFIFMISALFAWLSR